MVWGGAPSWAKVDVIVWHIDVAQVRAACCGWAGAVEVTAGAAGGGADEVAGALLALLPQPATSSPVARMATASGRRNVAPCEMFMVSFPLCSAYQVGPGVAYVGQSDSTPLHSRLTSQLIPAPGSGLVLCGKGNLHAYDSATTRGAVGRELPAQEFGALLHTGHAVAHRSGTLGGAGWVEADTVV